MAKVITPFATLSYPRLFEPEPVSRGGKTVDKFSCTLVFDADADLTEMKAAAFAAAEEKHGEAKAKQMLEKGQLRMVGGAHHSFRTDAAAKGYPAGSIFINASSTGKQPGVVDGQLQPITDPERLYPGCVVRAQVAPYYYDVDGNRGVAWGLENIQFVRDGDRLDGRQSAADAFSALAPEDFGEEVPAPQFNGRNDDVFADLLK